MKLYIRYMVSMRCQMVVKEELKKLGLHYSFVDMGVAEIMENLTKNQHEQFRVALLKTGLELMEDKRAVLVEKIKDAIIEAINKKEESSKISFSEYISKKLNYDYTYLANLFSEVQGTTIEKFIIAYKIERVKELIIYDELNFTEIAWNMHYSSVAHLSNQFRKVTGLTPSHFKALRKKRKNAIENN